MDDVDELFYSALITETLNETYERTTANYDGVSGSLPDWVPEWRVQEFNHAGGRLLDKYKQYQIVKWMNAHDININATGEYVRLEFIPLEVKNDISFLVLIRRAVNAGEKEGLKMLAGNLASHGKDFSKGGSTKKGKFYEPKASVKTICDEIRSFEFDKVLDYLKDADKCLDGYESTINPTGVLFSGVEDDAKNISYIKRGKNPDNPKSISFDRLRNILAELKK